MFRDNLGLGRWCCLSVKGLLLKHDELNSIPRTHLKRTAAAQTHAYHHTLMIRVLGKWRQADPWDSLAKPA